LPPEDPGGLATLAAKDLSAAEVLAGQPTSFLWEPALFHCQQAGEKWIKALLGSRGVAYPRTHDLRDLLTLARELEEGLADLAPSAEILTAMAVAPRYHLRPVSGWYVIVAISCARRVRDAVLPLLPPDVCPNVTVND